MPTYEYACGKCGHNFEIFQSISSDPVNKCPKCGSNVRRLIGAGSGIIFKGRKSDINGPAKPICGQDQTCCGRDVPCGKSNECRE